MTEAQKTLYYIAENMHMDKSISDVGYEHFQQAIKALSIVENINKMIAEIEHHRRKTAPIDSYDLIGDCLDIINKYCVKQDVNLDNNIGGK